MYKHIQNFRPLFPCQMLEQSFYRLLKFYAIKKMKKLTIDWKIPMLTVDSAFIGVMSIEYKI